MRVQGSEYVWLSVLKVEDATQPSEAKVVYIFVYRKSEPE